MKASFKNIAVAIAIPLLVGGISSLISSGAMSAFAGMNKPPLSPPGWLFPVAWTALYVCMGLASFFIFMSGREETRRTRRTALVLYAGQLVLNFIWSPIFFNAGLYYPALVVLIVLWLLVAALFFLSAHLDKRASVLLVPYLLWLSFAGYLNAMIPLLN